MRRFSPDEVQAQLSGLQGWRLDGGKLFREFEFEDFPTTFGFMSSVALLSESLNHHPEWSNVYTHVKIWLNSHEVDGISELDIQLATKINALGKEPA